jgi:hypothetical protein
LLFEVLALSFQDVLQTVEDQKQFLINSSTYDLLYSLDREKEELSCVFMCHEVTLFLNVLTELIISAVSLSSSGIKDSAY